jgi:hypothetical protein
VRVPVASLLQEKTPRKSGGLFPVLLQSLSLLLLARDPLPEEVADLDPQSALVTQAQEITGTFSHKRRTPMAPESLSPPCVRLRFNAGL